MRKFSVILAFAVLFLAAFCACASADPAAPQNLRWKEGSTATAVWDAVLDANYYYVKVTVYHNGTKIGDTETGTASSEIDLQSQISTVVGTNAFAVVKASFSVCAAVISDSGGETVKGPFSGESEQYGYKLQELDVPQNLALNDQWILSWDTVDSADHFEYGIKFSREGNELTAVHSVFMEDGYQVSSTQSQCDLSNIIRMYYTQLCQKREITPGDEVAISVRLSARAWIGTGAEAYELMTGFSEYVGGMNYSASDIELLDVPSGLDMSDQWVLSWNTVDDADHYEYGVKFAKEGNELTIPHSVLTEDDYRVSGAKTQCDLSEIIKRYYTQLCQEKEIAEGDEVTISVRLSARKWVGTGSDSSELMTAFSDYTAGKNYSDTTDTLLDTPSGLQLSDRWILSWDTVDGATHYEYGISTFKDGTEIMMSYGFIPENNIQTDGTRSFADLTNDIKKHYSQLCQDREIGQGDEITIRFRLSARKWEGTGADSYEIMSDFSEYSGAQAYAGEIPVEAITLSPAEPILYKGHDLYLGITILPENAVYHSVKWSSSAPAMASIDDAGKITGISEGQAVITAAINQTEASVPVNVYTVKSNLEDEADQKEVSDTAGLIIDEIGNKEVPDLDGTDLAQEDVSEIREDIQAGMERGDTFRSDIQLSKRDRDYFKEYWDEMEEVVEGGVFAGGYDIRVEIYHQDGEGNKYHIANITRLGEEIGFTIEGETLPEPKEGQQRDFYLIRIHEGKVEAVPVGEAGDNLYTSRSDCFSDFVLMYKDRSTEPQKIPEEPVRDGLVEQDGRWLLMAGGEVQTQYSGLYCDPAYGWWLVRNGAVDFDYTGLYGDPNYGWWLIGSGGVCFDYNGLWGDPNYGWWLVSGGAVNFGYTGLYYDENVGWWLIGNGGICFDYNGLWGDPVFGWWLVSGGTVNFGYTGLYYDENVGWWLIGNGGICFDYNGLWGDPVFGWWLISGGTVNFGYTGLYYDENVGWWLIGSGGICFDYTGLWGDPVFGWWLVSGGTVNFGYTGLYYDENVGWWLVCDGTIAFGYNGFWEDPAFDRWLVQGGTVSFGYTGYFDDPNLGTQYVENGRMIDGGNG